MVNRFNLLFITVMLCGAYGSAKPSLFSDSIPHSRMEDVVVQHPWLQSSNAAGQFSLNSSLSEASVYAGKDNGKWVNYYESDNSFRWGANASSFTRLNSRTVVSGLIEYSHFSGKHMGGSFFINPYHAPFDLVDYDINNKGKKVLETYHLNGTASYQLDAHWVIGAKFDYTAGNYAKQKDLRHVNDLMDLSTTIGGIYTTDRWDIGANYVFRKRNEGLGLGIFGTTEEVYKTLVSYGGFWGVVEQYGVEGYTSKTTSKPLIDKYHSGAFQLNWKPIDAIAFFNEIGFVSRKGYYGIEGTRSVVNSNHDSKILSYTGQLGYTAQQSLHQLRVNYSQEDLHNLENIYRFETTDGGLDKIGYYGQLETLQKKTQDIGILYTGYFGNDLVRPQWQLEAGYQFHHRKSTASFYPFFRKQDWKISTIHLMGKYNLYRTKDYFTFALGTQYRQGNGEPATDGIYAPPSSSQKPPKNSAAYLHHEMEYLTAKQMQHLLGIEYGHRIGKTKVYGLGGVKYQFAHAFKTKYIDDALRHTVYLHIGCTF